MTTKETNKNTDISNKARKEYIATTIRILIQRQQKQGVTK